jgi:hypothetical protein
MRGSRPGERRGGRRPGVPNKATAELRDLARLHGPAAIVELSRLATQASSEQARISACVALLDRGYGRSHVDQPVEIALPDTSTPLGLLEAIRAIVKATACGELPPSAGQALCSLVRFQREAIEFVTFEERLVRLEKMTAAGLKK